MHADETRGAFTSILKYLRFFILFFLQIDELKRKLSDFERVNKAQNSLNDHTSNLEQEMMRLKQK